MIGPVDALIRAALSIRSLLTNADVGLHGVEVIIRLGTQHEVHRAFSSVQSDRDIIPHLAPDQAAGELPPLAGLKIRFEVKP